MEMERAACGLPQKPGSTSCTACRIRHRAFCAALDPAELAVLEDAVEDISLGADRPVFYEYDPADYIYNVFAGTLKTYKLLQDGRRQMLGFHVAGDLLGFSHGPSYAYNADTLTPARLCRVSRRRLRDMAAEFPALETKLLEITAKELAESQAQMVVLGRKSAAERMASFLVRLSDKSVAAGGVASPITLTMSRHDIADYAGLTAETVSRVLTQFSRAGLISLPEPHRIVLERPDELRRLAEADEID